MNKKAKNNIILWLIIGFVLLSIFIVWGLLTNWKFIIYKDDYIETSKNIKYLILQKAKKDNNDDDDDNEKMFQTIIENDKGTYDIVDMIKGK